jgi:hypothetical protein
VLKRIVGTKREEVAGGCRTLHKEELHNMYASPNIIMVIKSRGMGWVRHVAGMRCVRNAYSTLVVKPEGKRPLRRIKHTREGNIRMNLGETGWQYVDWIQLAQDRKQS